MTWAHLAALNLVELTPPNNDLAIAYGFHSCISSMLGWGTRGARYGERALEVAREVDNLWTQGYIRGYLGIGLFASARYEEGLAIYDDAIRDIRKAGDLWELNLFHFHKGCCHFGLGNLVAAVEEARKTFAASVPLGDSRTLCSTYLWARATRGNIPFEEVRSCFPRRPDDVMSTVHGIMAEGHWHTFHGRTGEALRAFETAGALVRKSLCLNSHMIVALPELAAALRRHSEPLSDGAPAEAERHRRRATRLARWAVRLTRLFPASYPMSLRELSILLADQGQAAKALRLADLSLAVAERQKAKYEHAQTLLVRGRIARRLDLPEADEQVRTAEAAIEALERPLRETAG